MPNFAPNAGFTGTEIVPRLFAGIIRSGTNSPEVAVGNVAYVEGDDAPINLDRAEQDASINATIDEITQEPDYNGWAERFRRPVPGSTEIIVEPGATVTRASNGKNSGASHS